MGGAGPKRTAGRPGPERSEPQQLCLGAAPS